MIAACVAIILVVLISSFMCIRSGYKMLGPSILPIALVPFGHIIGSQILLLLNNKSIVPEMAAMAIVTAVDVAALFTAAAVIIVYSKSFFKRKAMRRSYCSIMTDLWLSSHWYCL